MNLNLLIFPNPLRVGTGFVIFQPRSLADAVRLKGCFFSSGHQVPVFIRGVRRVGGESPGGLNGGVLVVGEYGGVDLGLYGGEREGDFIGGLLLGGEIDTVLIDGLLGFILIDGDDLLVIFEDLIGLIICEGYLTREIRDDGEVAGDFIAVLRAIIEGDGSFSPFGIL